jgi:predicted dehydrogenase
MPTPLPEDRPIRWGILGAGGIAEKLGHDIGITPGNEVVAVAARDADRAADFALRHRALRSYGSYEALVNDDEVDVVYVSTTHPYHLAHSLLAIDAGKAVLVEKPVALNAHDARRLFEAAADADVFAMEAMWMRINPLVVRATELIAAGVIGDVHAVRFEFGLGVPFDPSHRLYDIDNGGGALLDLGVYPASFAYHFLGKPDEVRTSGTLAPNGVDDTVYMEWCYDGIPRAQLWCSVPVIAPNRSAVMGDRGWLEFEPEAYRPTGLTVHAGDEQYTVADPLAGQGYGYGPEVLEVERCLRAGLAQSPSLPFADTIAILEVLDGARASLGVTYPNEARS